MTNQADKASQFKGLHQPGNPIVLFNIWDAGSARAVADAGAQALATGSLPVAMAHGFADGEQLPIEDALANMRRITAAVDLPVTMDFESGYAREADAAAENLARGIDAGAIGFNFEDQVIGGDEGAGLYDMAEQQSRLEAVRSRIDASGVPAFLNARTDIFLKAARDTHSDAMLDEAIERAKAYAASGGDGFFAPGLADERLIQRLCEACPMPVNIIALPGVPDNATLARCGVARISYGPVPYRQLMKALTSNAAQALE